MDKEEKLKLSFFRQMRDLCKFMISVNAEDNVHLVYRTAEDKFVLRMKKDGDEKDLDWFAAPVNFRVEN